MFKSQVGFVVLIVMDPQKSGEFYSRLLKLEPIKEVSTFVMFVFNNGFRIGLWSKTAALPKVISAPGATEICLKSDRLDELYEEWKKDNVRFAQTPVELKFGRTFVALDPDGHRIRIYSPHHDQQISFLNENKTN